MTSKETVIISPYSAHVSVVSDMSPGDLFIADQEIRKKRVSNMRPTWRFLSQSQVNNYKPTIVMIIDGPWETSAAGACCYNVMTCHGLDELIIWYVINNNKLIVPITEPLAGLTKIS
jgi:hypothetical protein